MPFVPRGHRRREHPEPERPAGRPSRGRRRYLPRGVQRHGGVPAGRGPHRAVPLRPAEGSGQSALSHQPVQCLGSCGTPAHPDRLQGRGAVYDLLRGGDEPAPAGVQPHRGGKRLPSHAGRLHHGLPLPGQQLGIRHDTPPLPGRRISGCGGGLSERERLDEAVQPVPVRRHPHQAQRRCHRLLERLLPLPEERQQVPSRRRGAVCEGGWEPLSAQQPLAGKRHGAGLFLHLLTPELRLSSGGAVPDLDAGPELVGDVRPHHARHDRADGEVGGHPRAGDPGHPEGRPRPYH